MAKRLIFVGHSGLDTWVARQIAREIEACGAIPLVDAGADFEEDILQFLEKAHELVVLLTPWALDRPYVWGGNRGCVGPPHSDCGAITRDHGDGVADAAWYSGVAEEARPYRLE